MDSEVLRDLRGSDTVLTGPGHAHDVLAELPGQGAGMVHILPGRPRASQIR